MNFHHYLKNKIGKNLKFDFSFVSAHSIYFIKIWLLLNLHILSWEIPIKIITIWKCITCIFPVLDLLFLGRSYSKKDEGGISNLTYMNVDAIDGRDLARKSFKVERKRWRDRPGLAWGISNRSLIQFIQLERIIHDVQNSNFNHTS